MPEEWQVFLDSIKSPTTAHKNVLSLDASWLSAERREIWSGEIEWMDDKDDYHSLACSLSTAVVAGVAECEPEQWPHKLYMHMWSDQLVQRAGVEHHYRGAKSLRLHSEDSSSLAAMTDRMRTSGWTTGYVLTDAYTWSTVVLVLQYDQDSNTCSALVLSRQARTGLGDRLGEVVEEYNKERS